MRLRSLLFVALFLTASCAEPDVWQGWVYPDGSNLLVDIPVGAFDSLEHCRSAALAELEQSKLYKDGVEVDGDYECGLNCQPSGYGGNVCEKTER